MCRKLRFFFVVLVAIQLTVAQRSIYNRLTQENEFEGFCGLIKHNHDARMRLIHDEITIFVPTNVAFKKYNTPFHSQIALYHMSKGSWTLDDLKTVQNLTSLGDNFPKLWIATVNGSQYVNNAKVDGLRSDYHGRTGNGQNGYHQRLHVIDQVLDPLLVSFPCLLPPHTAYQFLTSAITHFKVDTFRYKVQKYKLEHLFQIDGANTYFIPIDDGFLPYKFKMLNKYAVFGHVVPNFVLFTEPTLKREEQRYETMADDEGIYIVVAFETAGDKIYVKSHTVTGNSNNNPKGVFVAEILVANIPVFNGVVHLISQPLGIPTKTLKPFPFLPIIDKLATDPTLDTFYQMGEKTGFNKIFTTNNATFTNFVLDNYAWRQIDKKGLRIQDNDVDLLKRHLIISDSAYTMEKLLVLTHVGVANNNIVKLRTVGGPIKLAVLEIEGNYYIKWKNTFVKVIRPNYECSNGILHVLAGPLAELK